MTYAKRLTKERLINEGFTEITKEGRLFKGDREVFPHWNKREGNTNRYLCITLNQRDSEGHLIKGKDRVYKYTRKDGTVGEYTSWNAKAETFGLHRVIWAWFHDEVPEGYVVDHINNQHSRIEDYHLDNLQLLTPKENITKERICNVKEIHCKLDRPRSYYEDKLAKYEELYEKAKQEHNAKDAAKRRGNLSSIKARLRYWDNHRKEAETLMANKKEYTEAEAARLKAKKQFKKDCMELSYWKKVFKENKNKKLWKECCTIEKMVKEKKEEAWPVVKHALDVIYKTFGG